MLLELLNKNDASKISVLMTLENHPENTFISQLMAELDLSEYQVRMAIESLIVDVNRLGLKVPLFEIKILENKTIRYTRKSPLSGLNYLQYIYSMESNFHPFFNNFLLERSTSQVNFLNENFFSKTLFFRLRKKFDKTLQKFNISMTSKVELLGKEHDIRSFLYIYLLTSYGDVKRPFTVKLETEFNILIDNIQIIIQKKFTTAMRLKLQYYFYVIFVRSGLNHFYSHTDIDISNNDDFVKEIFFEVDNYFDFPNDYQAMYVTKELLLFLFSEGEIYKSKEIIKTLPIIADIRQQFEVFFQLKKEDMDDLFTPEINLNFSQFIIHLAYFNYPVNLLTRPENNGYLNDNFQDFNHFCEQIIKSLRKHLPQRESFIIQNQLALATDLLLLIIANFNLSNLIKPVVITLDFTYGNNYTKFIEKELHNFNSLNLKIQRHMNEKTDIIISNLSPQVDTSVHKIQWTSPPSATDWSFLGNLIVSIKKERNNNHDSAT
ncbi:helix-turn-helix domain-containing protein [Leuconostoc pseudomesenteroides]|uniref:helix-turn-helix domain-containing protein n=1 Tax=Leuconostoc pseudomesenteroides TaxID=33968 RepID=UPI004034FE4A